MSSNYESSYALNNQCTPCHLMGDSRGNAYDSLLNSPRRISGSSRQMPTVSMARSHSSHYTDPAVARSNRILSAINHSDSSSTPITPQETQHLAGYTGGTRVAFGQP